MAETGTLPSAISLLRHPRGELRWMQNHQVGAFPGAHGGSPFPCAPLPKKLCLDEFMVGDGAIHSVDNKLDALLDFGHFLGRRRLAQLHSRPGRIQQLKRFAEKLAFWKVATRVERSTIKSFIGISYPVELLIPVLASLQHAQSAVLVHGTHVNGSEAISKPRNRLRQRHIVAWGTRADALNLPSQERGLENFDGFRRSRDGSRCQKRLQIVEEQDDIESIR